MSLSLANNTGPGYNVYIYYRTVKCNMDVSKGFPMHKTRAGSWKEALSKHVHRSSAQVPYAFPK